MSDAPADGPAMDQQMDQLKDQRWTSDAGATSRADGRTMHEGQRNSQTNRQTRDGPAMDQRWTSNRATPRPADGRASHGPRLEQTRERRTMDDRETRQLYHRRLERLVDIAPNSHRYACCTCFASVIHTEEEELHSHKLHRDKGTIDDGIHAIPHGLDAITAISSISALLLPLQSPHYAQPMEKNATLTNAVHLQLQSLLNSQ